MLSLESFKRGMESRRGITGSESQAGRSAARSVLLDESGDGWAWSRRCERCFQVGRGTVLICDIESAIREEREEIPPVPFARVVPLLFA